MGRSAPLSALASDVAWSTSGSFSGVDMEGGVDMTVKNDGVPYTLWGKVKKSITGVADVSAGVEVDSSDLQSYGVDLEASRGETKVAVKGTANANDSTFDLMKLRLSQKLAGGKLNVSPEYDFESQKAGVGVDYDLQGTVLSMSADEDSQKLKVLKPLDDKSSISPSFSTEGDLEVEYKRSVADGTVTATYKPDDSLNVKYEDGPYVVNVKTPLEGYYKPSAMKFDVRRALV